MHSDSARWSAAASSVLSASPGSTAWHACRSARNISGATPSRLFAGAEATVLSCAVALAVDDSTAGEGARAGASAAAGVAFGTGTGAGAGVSVGAGAAARADLSADAGAGAAALLELAVFGWAAGFRRLNLKPPSSSGPKTRFLAGGDAGDSDTRLRRVERPPAGGSTKFTLLRRVSGIPVGRSAGGYSTGSKPAPIECGAKGEHLKPSWRLISYHIPPLRATRAAAPSGAAAGHAKELLLP